VRNKTIDELGRIGHGIKILYGSTCLGTNQGFIMRLTDIVCLFLLLIMSSAVLANPFVPETNFSISAETLSKTGFADQNITFNFTAENLGNVPDIIAINTDETDWELFLSSGERELAIPYPAEPTHQDLLEPQDERNFSLAAHIPPSPNGYSKEIILDFYSYANPEVNETIRLSVYVEKGFIEKIIDAIYDAGRPKKKTVDAVEPDDEGREETRTNKKQDSGSENELGGLTGFFTVSQTQFLAYIVLAGLFVFYNRIKGSKNRRR